MRSGPENGRTVGLHPQEGLLQEARAFHRSEAFAPCRKLRQVAEHPIARLMQVGLLQARYFGRAKTLGQLLLAAMVANLTLVAAKMGPMRGPNKGQDHFLAQACRESPALVGMIMAPAAYCLGLAHHTRPSAADFRPGF